MTGTSTGPDTGEQLIGLRHLEQVAAVQASSAAVIAVIPSVRAGHPYTGPQTGDMLAVADIRPPTRVIVLIPAHNEAASIGATITSLRAQTRRPSHITVVCDNCTDDTAAIARRHGAEVMFTAGNKARKAGALNQALARMLPYLGRHDLLLAKDADSSLTPGWLDTAAKVLEADRSVGAVCGVFLGEPGAGLVGQVQRNEYVRYARIVSRRWQVPVLSGTGTLFRVPVLREIGRERGNRLPGSAGLFYNPVSITEDDEITLVDGAPGRLAGNAAGVPDRARIGLCPVPGMAVLPCGSGEHSAPRDRMGSRLERSPVVIAAVLLSGGPAWVFVKLVTLLFALASVVQLLPARNRQVPNYRARPWRAAFTYGGSGAAAAALIAGCAALATAHPARTAHVTAPAPHPLVGVVTDDVGAFDARCSCRPQIAVRYMRWGQSFPGAEARLMIAHGAEPLIELEPYSVRLASITAGRSDAWLRSYAASVRSLGAPVLLSFAPEANGTWYSWGYRHAAARDFIAAWRHVVTLFRRTRAGARWVWVMNASFKHSEPLGRLWPGSRYVDEIGVDGYFTFPRATFTSGFGPTISQIRHLTSKPVLITETAADPTAGKARVVAQLVSGVERYKLAGFIWFSINQLGNRDPGAPKTNRHDWSLEDDPGALAAYRAAVDRDR